MIQDTLRSRYGYLVPIGPLSKSKNTRPRADGPQEAEQEPDRELESYLAAITPEGANETTDTGRRFSNAQVYQLRMPLSANEQLRWLAQERGTSPLTLVQEWVLQRLAWEARQRGGQQSGQPDPSSQTGPLQTGPLQSGPPQPGAPYGHQPGQR